VTLTRIALSNPVDADEPIISVLDVMQGLRAAVAELSDNELPRAGLQMVSNYDETTCITASIGMARNNLLLGMGRAGGLERDHGCYFNAGGFSCR